MYKDRISINTAFVIIEGKVLRLNKNIQRPLLNLHITHELLISGSQVRALHRPPFLFSVETQIQKTILFKNTL